MRSKYWGLFGGSEIEFPDRLGSDDLFNWHYECRTTTTKYDPDWDKQALAEIARLHGKAIQRTERPLNGFDADRYREFLRRIRTAIEKTKAGSDTPGDALAEITTLVELALETRTPIEDIEKIKKILRR